MEPKDTEKKPKLRDEKGLFVEGTPGGPGRPKGLRDFSTDFDEAVEEIAEEEKITVSDARKQLLKVAYRNAVKGNYNFYKDTIDRNYGAVSQKTDITTKGEPIKSINYIVPDGNNPPTDQ